MVVADEDVVGFSGESRVVFKAGKRCCCRDEIIAIQLRPSRPGAPPFPLLRAADGGVCQTLPVLAGRRTHVSRLLPCNVHCRSSSILTLKCTFKPGQSSAKTGVDRTSIHHLAPRLGIGNADSRFVGREDIFGIICPLSVGPGLSSQGHGQSWASVIAKEGPGYNSSCE